MNPRALPHERPSQGYTPPAPPQFWRVLLGITLWGSIIAAMFAIAYPLLLWVVMHVAR